LLVEAIAEIREFAGDAGRLIQGQEGEGIRAARGVWKERPLGPDLFHKVDRGAEAVAPQNRMVYIVS
jgi:hypothetical protein